MKKAINVWSFPAGWPLERKFRAAQAAGFAGFEIDLSENGPVTGESSPAALAAVRAEAGRCGLILNGLATGLYWEYNPASGESAIRARARGVLERQIAAAAALGIDAVLVVPGSVGADFIPGCEIVPYETAWQRATAFIRDALPIAEKAGVRLCIENVWNKFLLSPLEMRGFLLQFESEWVGAYLDVGNSVANGYPEHWIEALGPLIRRVHVKDYRKAAGGIDGFVELLAGDVNWPEVMRALRAIGYDGWLTAEMIPPIPFYRHAPEVLIGNTSRALDAILSF
jgi:L-ribulose-5-phosphate 3-epimerase